MPVNVGLFTMKGVFLVFLCDSRAMNDTTGASATMSQSMTGYVDGSKIELNKDIERHKPWSTDGYPVKGNLFGLSIFAHSSRKVLERKPEAKAWYQTKVSPAAERIGNVRRGRTSGDVFQYHRRCSTAAGNRRTGHFFFEPKDLWKDYLCTSQMNRESTLVHWGPSHAGMV
jgi:hypothetical protein